MRKLGEYVNLIKLAKEKGREVAKELADALKPVIPGIKYSVGWEEGQLDLVFSESDEDEDKRLKGYKGSKTYLDYILYETIPELIIDNRPYVTTDIWLTPEEQKKVS